MMKRICCLFLTLALLLAGTAVPAAADDTIWVVSGIECVEMPGGLYRATRLESGKSYYFTENASLILDTDLDCPVLFSMGDLWIGGQAQLSSRIIYSAEVLTVDTGTVVCSKMETPPDPETTVRNGLTGFLGVEIKNGTIRCPVISGGIETVTVSGGEVQSDLISAIFGYDQYGGTVDAGEIRAREGIGIEGGELKMGVGRSEFYFLSGGTIEGRFEGIESGERPGYVFFEFPMRVVSPQGAAWRDGQFVDAAGKSVQNVRAEWQEVSHPFKDVRFDAYYYDAMVWAYEHDPRITDGVRPDAFAPDGGCTRGQTVTFLCRAAGCPETDGKDNAFTDLTECAFYEQAVAWAVESGITNGTDETHFSPDLTCTRGQVVTFLWRAAGSPEPEGTASAFTDLKPGAYYEKAVAWAVENGITKGTDETHFSPDVTCTRGQVVTFLYRAQKQ